MRKNLKRFCAPTALLLLLCTVFLSCSSGSKKVFFTYKNTQVSEASYRFWLSEIKSTFVNNYEDVTDTPECWNRKTKAADGGEVTWAEYVEQYAQQYAKNMAVELALFDEYGLSLSDEQNASVDNYINELIYYRYSDSKSVFNESLKSVYGIDADELREALIEEQKVAVLEDYLFGSDGLMKPTEQEKKDYYEKNYARIQVLLIYTDAEYQLDDDGNVKQDITGNPILVSYSEEQKAEKRKKADAVYEMALSGEDFTSLVSTYGELQIKTHPEGFYFCPDDLMDLIAQGYDRSILISILQQEIGSCARYESEHEAIFIVKRLTLEEEAYNLAKESDQFERMNDHIITVKNQKLLEERLDQVEVNAEVYDLKIVNINKGIL